MSQSIRPYIYRPYIYISYRHIDNTDGKIEKIYNSLREVYSPDEIFWDKIVLDNGLRDVTEEVNLSINSCDILLVIIGKEWIKAEEITRLKDRYDPVRLEIETCLRRSDVVVLPVLLNGTPMPTDQPTPTDQSTPRELPREISGLASKWAAKVQTDNDETFERNMRDLKTRLRARYARTGGVTAVGDFSVDFIHNALLREAPLKEQKSFLEFNKTSRKEKNVRIAQIWFSLLPHLMNIMMSIARNPDWDTKIKLLLLDPDCPAGEKRSEDLRKDKFYCKREIEHSLRIIISNFQKLNEDDHIEVRFYDEPLAFPIYWIDDTAVIGFYQHGKLSYEAPHLYIRNVPNDDTDNPELETDHPQNNLGNMVKHEFNTLWHTLSTKALDLKQSTVQTIVYKGIEKKP